MHPHQYQTSQQQNGQTLPSSVTETNSQHQPPVVETLEHRRFTEFCDSCRRYRYVGLCYGPPGVGKTLSARSYSRWDKVKQSDRWGSGPTEVPLFDTVFYTPGVVNTPGGIADGIRLLRDTLQDLAKRPVRMERQERLESIRQRDEDRQQTILYKHDWFGEALPELHPTAGEVAKGYNIKIDELPDPTTLIIIDEADRLRMASLEQVRAIFDASEVGIILIGMPGLEKRLARYAQFYSRIGFVHEFRPLVTTEIRRLLAQRWAPAGVNLPEQPWAEEAIAAVIRITGGNFRLLNRLLTQLERILEINSLREVTKDAVDAARESLVIGQA
jgi:DNA transposition AAA+ family ATPase